MGAEENDTALLLSLLRNCATAADVVDLLERVQGPYALVYWQVRVQSTSSQLSLIFASSKAKTKRLFFGKDKLGRRSLLLHRPSSPSDPFMLSSVASLSSAVPHIG